MTILDLGERLNTTGIEFAHFAWNPAPSGDYGTYAEDDMPSFEANNRVAERTTHAYVNLFTRDDTWSQASKVEEVFNDLQDEEVFAWSVNTIQYENDTKIIHVEWEVEFC